MFDRMEAVFRDAPAELQDTRALADIAEKRDVHAKNCTAPKAPECADCVQLDALAARALADPEGVDESALADVRILRQRHAPECKVPRGGERE
jgi:hypothetical protein